MNITLILNVPNVDEPLFKKIISFLNNISLVNWTNQNLLCNGQITIENLNLLLPSFTLSTVSTRFNTQASVIDIDHEKIIINTKEEHIPYPFIKGLKVDFWHHGKCENTVINEVGVWNYSTIELNNCKINKVTFNSIEKKHEHILRNNSIKQIHLSSSIFFETYLKLILSMFQEHFLVHTFIEDVNYNTHTDYNQRIYMLRTIQKFIIFLLHYIDTFEKYDLHDASIFKDIFSLLYTM